jgi:hypothetical protein
MPSGLRRVADSHPRRSRERSRLGKQGHAKRGTHCVSLVSVSLRSLCGPAAGRSSLLVNAAARCSRRWFQGKDVPEWPFGRPLALEAQTSTDISMTTRLEELSRLARPTSGPGGSRRGESFNFSRQVITHSRRSSR